MARKRFTLGKRRPRKGPRRLPDMKPVIGPAPDKAGLWLTFGHGYQGFTLVPATGELFAQIMDGETPGVDMTPFCVDRF